MYLISKVLRATGGQALDTVEGRPSKTGPVAHRNVSLNGHPLLSLVVVFCPFQDLVRMDSAACVCSLLFSPLLFSMPVVALAESSKSPLVLPELPPEKPIGSIFILMPRKQEAEADMHN